MTRQHPHIHTIRRGNYFSKSRLPKYELQFRNVEGKQVSSLFRKLKDARKEQQELRKEHVFSTIKKYR